MCYKNVSYDMYPVALEFFWAGQIFFAPSLAVTIFFCPVTNLICVLTAVLNSCKFVEIEALFFSLTPGVNIAALR
jgi:hypothetical protein